MVGDRTLSRSVGHKVLAVGDPAWDCMQSAADHHLDNADPHNDVWDPGAVDEENLDGPGAVDGEDLEGLGGSAAPQPLLLAWVTHNVIFRGRSALVSIHPCGSASGRVSP